MTRRVALRSLREAVPAARLQGDDVHVTGICYDSREVSPGDLFAALRGADFDGHQFVGGAEARGAAALLVEQPVDSALPQIVTANSRAALAAISAAFYGHPSRDVAVIGVTGTDGKTTTSYIIDHILRCADLRTGLIGTVAIRIGEQEDLHASRQTTPESNDVQRYLRQMADADVDWAILEATSHGLAMHRLDHVRFRIGAVTNITHEHLDYHGSVENYRLAKAILFQRVAETSGTVVVNADDAGARAIAAYAGGAMLLTYSAANNEASVRAREVAPSATANRFLLDAGEHGRAPVALPMIGAFNVANALCAAGVALAAGVDFATIVRALESVPAVPGRMTTVQAGQPFSVVVDYAHTPDSLRKVLQLLRGLHPRGRLIAVFGSAGERDVEKRPLQGEASARLADITIVTSEDPRNEDPDAIIAQIAAGAMAGGGKPGASLFTRTDREDAIRLAFALARDGDCVLLAGKGHEGSIIWGREKRPWDEAGVARRLLAAAGYGDGEA